MTIVPGEQVSDVTWAGTLIDGRQYKDYPGHRRIQGVVRCVCLLDDMHFWIVACHRNDEEDNPPVGPSNAPGVALDNKTLTLTGLACPKCSAAIHTPEGYRKAVLKQAVTRKLKT